MASPEPPGVDAPAPGGGTAALRERVLAVLKELVDPEAVETTRTTLAPGIPLMDALLAAGFDEEAVLLACCNAASVPPLPQPWLALPPTRAPVGLGAMRCIQLGVVPVGPGGGPLCLGYGAVEDVVGPDADDVPPHRKYLMLRRDHRRLQAAAGLRRATTARGAAPVRGVRLRSDAAFEEQTSPGTVAEPVVDDPTAIDGGAADDRQQFLIPGELNRTPTPAPHRFAARHESQIRTTLAGAVVSSNEEQAWEPDSELAAPVAPGDEEADGGPANMVGAHASGPAVGDEDEAANVTTNETPAASAPRAVLESTAVGVAAPIPAGQAEHLHEGSNDGSEYGVVVGSERAGEDVDARPDLSSIDVAVRRAAAADDDVSAEERVAQARRTGPPLRGARTATMASLDPALPPSAVRRPPTIEFAAPRTAARPRTVPGLAEPAPGLPARAPRPSPAQKSSPATSPRGPETRRPLVVLGLGVLVAVGGGSLLTGNEPPAGGSPAVDARSAAALSAAPAPTTATAPTTVTTPILEGAPKRSGLDLEARQREHLRKALAEQDDRAAIQELSLVIRLDPRTTAARDALLARARRYVAVGERSRAEQDVQRLRGRTDLEGVGHIVDEIAGVVGAVDAGR
jgi:hypothetical protein